MLIKRSIISLLSKQKSTVSIASKGIRAFASTELKTQNGSKPKSVASELLRTLKAEIEAQKNLIKEQPEELEAKNVLKSYDAFLKENKWTVEHAENSTAVTMKRRDEGLQADVAINFDLMEVFNEVVDAEDLEEFNEEQEEEEEVDQEIETSTEMDEIDEDVDFLALPFSIEIKRDSIPDKSLRFNCVLEGTSDQNEIIIENASIIPSDSTIQSAYISPSYNQLDADLQESFEGFVNELVGSEELMGFVMNYSIASEASMYQKWMKDVASIIKN